MPAFTDYFCELIDFAMPWDEGIAVVLVAYVDASKRDGNIFCVAGFGYGADRAKKGTRAWRGVWGDTICHMSDLHTRKAGSAFESWSCTKAADYLKRSVPIINKYRSYGVAVSCDLDEIYTLAPKTAATDSLQYLVGFKHAYAICCHAAMALLGTLSRENGLGGDIAYFFESGDEHQAESQRFISTAVANPLLKDYYRHRSHALMDKGDARLMESSDIFAWEWAKHRERLRQGKSMRGSLKALLGQGIEDDEKGFVSPAIKALHVHGEPLERYFANVKSMILSSDDVAMPLLVEYLAKHGTEL